MALTLRVLRPRSLPLQLLPRPTPLSISASPPDHRELLRIGRILDGPAAAEHPQPQEHPLPAATAAAATSSLRHHLHRTAGITAAESASLLRRFPGAHTHHRLVRLLDELLAMDPGEPTRLLELLHDLRCRKPVKDQVLAHGPLRAAVAARRRVELLHARGLTRRDSLSVLAREPRVILYGLEDVERKVEFLVNIMGFEIGWLLQYPEFLGVNLDNWIVPRHNVVEHLRSVGGLGDPVEMKHYVRLSRRKFYLMFVKPYPECERIFGGPVREREEKMVRRRHPTGLWKLFTPTKHERTDDVKNMKLFVESLR